MVRVHLVKFMAIIQRNLIDDASKRRPRLFARERPHAIVPITRPIRTSGASNVEHTNRMIGRLPVNFRHFRLAKGQCALASKVSDGACNAKILIIGRGASVPRAKDQVSVFPLLHVAHRSTTSILRAGR